MSDIEDMQKENDMDDNEPLSGGGGGRFLTKMIGTIEISL